MVTIRAKLKRKEWVRWAMSALGDGAIPERRLSEALVAWARLVRSDTAAALSFESDIVDEGAAIAVVVQLLNDLRWVNMIAIVGDSDDPQPIVVALEDVGRILHEGTRRGEVVALTSISEPSSLLLTVSREEDDCKLLLVGSGSGETLVQRAHARLGVGTVFRGN
jgi:hypothetical protein